MAYVSDTISQIWGSDKCLEARNTLQMAYTTDYAMLQGCGGQDHARISGIYTCITDTSEDAKKRNNGSSPTIGATVPTAEFSKAKKIAEFNLGSTFIDEGDLTNGFNAIGSIAANIYSMYVTTVGIITGLGVMAGNLITGKLSRNNIPNEICSIAKKARSSMQDNCRQTYSIGRSQVPLYKDWEHTQTRVNTYKKFPDGRVAVTLLSISRKQFQVINNVEQKQEKPWTVYISQFRAAPVSHQNGTVTYNNKTKADETFARIKLDDSQMFDFCHRIEHFETVWEMANCCSLVREGLKMKHEYQQIN